METYDVVVIGAGPGGYVAAIRAAQLGMQTAIIDKEWLGGVCLNVGCIPSKALLKNAEVAHTLRERGKDFGFTIENLHLDYAAAVKRSRQVSDRLTRGIGFLMKKNNIPVIMGTARFTARDTVVVTDNQGQEREVKAKNFIVATGSQPVAIPGVTVDGQKVISFRDAILQEKLPASVVIIGAGAIGLEFATIWSSYGVQVTLVEMLPRIAPLEDEEISSELQKSFSKRGIKIMTDTRVMSVEKNPTGVLVKVAGKDGEVVLEAEQALMAIGFKPNSLNLGLEEIGVELTDRKHIKVDERMSTSVPGIWAVGDVTGKLLLAHVASTQGILCAEAIGGKETKPIDYTMVPRATYSQPQVASFGYTETQARNIGKTIKVGKFPFQPNGKALGLGDYAGFV
ncbi:MAG TPA: dihydrolipoyl dehydrogenase, partial [Anaerolineaceae bacterium]|nr:dihydrolipoyl dehydrogenase [Anaerolineaceae bacterium]